MALHRHSVVTGGSGFIGTHLVGRLLERGERVTILDVRPPKVTTGDGRAEWVRGDIRDVDTLAGALEGGGIPTLYHLAALTGVRQSAERAEEYHAVNVEGTESVASAARSFGVERVIFTSSSSVYGHGAPLPTPETHPPDPGSPYATSKLGGEEVLRRLTESSDSPDVRIARLFTVYGPGARPGMMIPTLIDSARRLLPLPLFGSRESSRDFTYVDDAVDALLLLADVTEDPGPVNIGTGISTSLGELISEVERITSQVINVTPHPQHPCDLFATLADLTRARSLGFAPRVTLRDGLERMAYHLHRGVESER